MTFQNKKSNSSQLHIIPKNDKPLFTFIDLFAGIGGFHIALSSLGGKCVFASEWDKDARKTYIANFSDVSPELFQTCGIFEKFAGDITKIDSNIIPDHDILCGGFPCQPFSQSGFKRGFEDARGTLFFDIARIIKSKNPKVVLLENVRGLLGHDNGRTFEVITKVIQELGYSLHYKVIKASDFGLPQHRPRLYMVCFRSDLNDSNFNFPVPLPLQMTMSDVFNGAHVNREIGFTLRVGGRGSAINDRRNWDGYVVNGVEVRIKPEEGKRMQGFPKDFVFPVSDSIAMKQLGNSVAIPVITNIVGNILKVLNQYSEEL